MRCLDVINEHETESGARYLAFWCVLYCLDPRCFISHPFVCPPHDCWDRKDTGLNQPRFVHTCCTYHLSLRVNILRYSSNYTLAEQIEVIEGFTLAMSTTLHRCSDFSPV